MTDRADGCGPAPQTTGPPALREALDRILASEPFARAEAVRSLLRVLVERRLAGNEGPIEEYVLGVEVLRRPRTYDPRADPIVRVQMRQLRLKLGAYYASTGHDDPVRLEVPKGEYRIVATPRAADHDRAGPPEVPVASQAPRAPRGRARFWGAALGVAAGLLAVGWMVRHPESPPNLRPALEVRVPSVAVLPFEDLGNDPALAFFSDGLADDLLVALMRLDGLRVTGRTSSFSLRGVAPGEAGRRLGVDATITGSVRKADARFRVAVRLVRTSDDLLLWSDAFDGTVGQTLEIQDRIARAVADALRLRVDPTAGQPFVVRGNADPRAHALYVEARQLMAARRAPTDLPRVVALLDEAIARDAGHAMAHAGLADALSTLAYNGQVPPGEGLARARAAANRALALDPRLGEALAHLASLSAFVDWNWGEADRQFSEALRLAPSHARIHAWRGQALLVQRRFPEALDMLLTAQRLDPLAPSVVYAVGEGYLYWGRYDDAIVQARRLLDLNPLSWGGHNLLARASLQLGRHDDVRAALRHSAGELWADVLALVAAGDRQGALAVLDRRTGELAESQPFHVASLYGAAGEAEQSVHWLQRAFARRQVDVVSLTVEPSLALVRTDPRVRELARRLGLADALDRPGASAPGASLVH